MGFLARLFGSADRDSAARAPGSRMISVPVGEEWGEIEASGESHRAKATRSFFQSIDRPGGGVTFTVATLELEPKNAYDKNAVKVVLAGQHIGYIPAGISGKVAARCRRLGRNEVATMPARVWGRPEDRGGHWHCRITLGYNIEPEPERDYAAEERLAEAAREEREAARQQREAARRERERVRAAGSINGTHWSAYRAEVTELKRQGALDDALARILQLIPAVERESHDAGTAPDPWPTEQACVVLTKLGRKDELLPWLDRYIAACGAHPVPDKITSRRLKALV